MTDAPDYTGIGCPEMAPPGVVPESMKTSLNSESNKTNLSEDGPTLQSQTEKVEKYIDTKEEKIEDKINSTQEERSKIVTELEESKSNLKELESKLATITQIYADLKK